jgi:hypothetical protein
MYGAAVEDPAQRRLWTINHEAGHAVAMWLRTGRAPREIDAYRPEPGKHGHTIPPSIPPIEIPDEMEGVEALSYIEACLDRQRKDVAIWSRAGAMAAGDDWETDPVCSSDRETFRAACERLPGGETLAEFETREMVDSPRFNALHKALTRVLNEKQGATDRTMYEPEIRACLEAADREFSDATEGKGGPMSDHHLNNFQHFDAPAEPEYDLGWKFDDDTYHAFGVALLLYVSNGLDTFHYALPRELWRNAAEPTDADRDRLLDLARTQVSTDLRAVEQEHNVPWLHRNASHDAEARLLG